MTDNPSGEQGEWHFADTGGVCCCTDGEHDGWKQPDPTAMLNGQRARILVLEAKLREVTAERDRLGRELADQRAITAALIQNAQKIQSAAEAAFTKLQEGRE